MELSLFLQKIASKIRYNYVNGGPILRARAHGLIR